MTDTIPALALVEAEAQVGPPDAHQYKSWRRPLDEIRHMHCFIASQFLLDEELNDWIRTRRHRIILKDATMID
ncbi:MAG: hypothetical protein JJ897_00450 [Marinibacterium sp.]|nr:hypothetical protein [Marinibacterium sp.]